MVTNKFKLVVGTIATVAIVGGVLLNEATLQAEVRNLQLHPTKVYYVNVTPTTEATPSATLTPKNPTRYYWPTKVSPTVKK